MDQIRPDLDGRPREPKWIISVALMVDREDHSGDSAWIIMGTLHGSELGLCMVERGEFAWIRAGFLHGSDPGLCMDQIRYSDGRP